MGKFRKQFYDELAREYEKEYVHGREKEFNAEERYVMAFKRVKRIKGFYVHVLVYLLVNAFIIVSANSNSESGIQWETFSTAFFWGIGLVAHGLSVFGGNIFFSQDWEERKIKEFMEKEKKQKWE